jgi:hypothetical protein
MKTPENPRLGICMLPTEAGNLLRFPVCLTSAIAAGIIWPNQIPFLFGLRPLDAQWRACVPPPNRSVRAGESITVVFFPTQTSRRSVMSTILRHLLIRRSLARSHRNRAEDFNAIDKEHADEVELEAIAWRDGLNRN